MAREINRLTSVEIKSISKPGLYADGLGLYLQVAAGGSKTWVFRFYRNGRARKMGLGSVHIVPLKEAREQVTDLQRQLRDGNDPIDVRKDNRVKQAQSEAQRKTFEECATAYIASHRSGWKNPKHAQQWENTLKTYAYSHFGGLPVADISTSHVMNALSAIWHDKPETASRVRSRVENVLSWATTAGYRTGDNPARWAGHLKNLLPARGRVAKVKNFPALPYQHISEFMRELRNMEGVAPRALEFAILTAMRGGAVRKAKWSEVDFDNALWIAPSENMKGDKEHRTPMSKRALEILRNLPRERGNDHIFIGGRRPMLSENAFRAVIMRMPTQWRDANGDLITAHGFRSTFSDWSSEVTAYSSEVREMALAHSVGNKVEAAYRRGDLFEKRRRIMDDWADYCSKPAPPGENVVAIREAVHG